LELNEVIDVRMSLLEQEKKVYLTAVNQINCNMHKSLNYDIGTQFVNAYSRDLAGEVIRKHFNTADYKITVDELLVRILKFSYDSEFDPLVNKGVIKELACNCSDSASISVLKNVIATNLNSNNIQARNDLTYSTKYMTEKKAERLMEFYKLSENFQKDDENLNASIDEMEINKIYNDDKNGKIIKTSSKVIPELLVEEIVKNWERESNNGRKNSSLIERGYLDSNGMVTSKARKELLDMIKKSQDAENKVSLKNTKKDSGKHTIQSLGKILGGQFIYYVMPPLLYEIRMILMNKNITLDNAMEKLVKSKHRICGYVFSKMKVIFKGVGRNSMNKFIKSLFDIIIDMIKLTVEKMSKVAKNLILSTVDAIKVVCDKKSTVHEKANSIFNLFSVTITTFSIAVLCEYIEKQVAIPESLLFPIQTILTTVCTNFVMLILQKANLFDMRYGLLVTNIEKVIDEENILYVEKMNAIKSQANESGNTVMNEIKDEIQEMVKQFKKLNVYYEAEQGELEEENKALNTDMTFENEWLQYIGVAL